MSETPSLIAAYAVRCEDSPASVSVGAPNDEFIAWKSAGADTTLLGVVPDVVMDFIVWLWPIRSNLTPPEVQSADFMSIRPVLPPPSTSSASQMT